MRILNDNEFFISWNDEYEVGIEKIDEQHRKLIGLINKLYNAKSSNPDRDTLSRIFMEIKEYIREHFKTEEGHFDKYDYPDSISHKEEHHKLAEQVGSFYKDFLDNKKNIIF